jgi:hypothetical protein
VEIINQADLIILGKVVSGKVVENIPTEYEYKINKLINGNVGDNKSRALWFKDGI